MSSFDDSDIDRFFLSAKEVELKPLLAEAEDFLGLDEDELAAMDSYLSEAWFTGVRASHSEMLSRATQRRSPIGPGPVDIKPIEGKFQALMEKTAEGLDLPMPQTILAWELIGRAWLAGTRTFQSEVTAKILEADSDIAQEALEWLEENGE